MKEILHYIIKDACKHYFTEINPSKIKIKITHGYKWKNERRICGIWKWNPLTIQFDGEYLHKADVMSITEKIFHELMHIRLHLANKPEPKNITEEAKLDKEIYKIRNKLRQHDRDLIKQLTSK